MQAVTVHNDDFPVPHITVSPSVIQRRKRWGIPLPRGANKSPKNILVGKRENLVHSADDSTFSYIDHIGLMARTTDEEMHFLIIGPESDRNPHGTALLRLTVDSGLGGKSYITYPPGCAILSLHTYEVQSLSGSISRSDMLAIFKPGKVIHMERTGTGITHPFGTVRNNNGRIESAWTMTPS